MLTPGSMAASSFPIEHYRHLASSLDCNALTTPSGAWIDGVQCAWRPQNSFASANALLYDKKVKSLFIVMTVSDVLRFGCPVARLASLRVQSTAAGGTSVTDQMALREALERLKPQVRSTEANIHPSLRTAAEKERIL